MKLRFRMIFLLLAVLSAGCQQQQESAKRKISGKWRGTIDMQQNQLPFDFLIEKISDRYQVKIFNGEEEITIDEVVIKNDSFHLTFPIFDIELKAKLNGNQLNGIYRKNYLDDYVLPFNAYYQQDFRFTSSSNTGTPTADFSGKWDVTFIEEDGTQSVAVGIFNQKGLHVTGTFLTPVGDYRYLEGEVVNEQLMLSTFDGNHAFLFVAGFSTDSTLTGNFWSGQSWHESWTAIKNPNASLPSTLSLTYLKEGYDNIDFSFPDLEGNVVTPEDDRFKDKVVLLQIFGTWCPNCMDETIFYADWYRKNKDRGVMILGLAYEQKDDFDYAVKRVLKMKEKLNAGYDYVIAGISDKEEASKTLPMLNHIISFPTTIFLDRKGKIRRIHTGFSGPGTGKYYEQYMEEFVEFTEMLIAE